MPSSSLVAAWERQTTSRHTGKMSRYDEWRKPPSQCRNLLQKHCQKQHVTQPDKYQILLLSPSEVSQATPAHRGHPAVPEAPTRSPAVPGWSTRPRAAGRQWGEQPAAARRGTTHPPTPQITAHTPELCCSVSHVNSPLQGLPTIHPFFFMPLLLLPEPGRQLRLSKTRSTGQAGRML